MSRLASDVRAAGKVEVSCESCRLIYSRAHCLHMGLCMRAEQVGAAQEHKSDPKCDLCEDLLRPVWLFLNTSNALDRILEITDQFCFNKRIPTDVQHMVFTFLCHIPPAFITLHIYQFALLVFCFPNNFCAPLKILTAILIFSRI